MVSVVRDVAISTSSNKSFPTLSMNRERGIAQTPLEGDQGMVFLLDLLVIICLAISNYLCELFKLSHGITLYELQWDSCRNQSTGCIFDHNLRADAVVIEINDNFIHAEYSFYVELERVRKCHFDAEQFELFKRPWIFCMSDY